MNDGILHPKTKDYGKLPSRIIQNTAITDGAARLYAYMHWRYGNNHDNHESIQSMASVFDVSQATITNRIKELEANDWVVTIERGYDPKSGKYLTPFYHVFEVQQACRDFRKQYQPADGERIAKKPEARARKSRRGIGGNPHLHNSSSEGDNPHNSSSPGNSSFAVPQNSSFANPVAFDPEEQIQTDSLSSRARAQVELPDDFQSNRLFTDLDDMVAARNARIHPPPQSSAKVPPAPVPPEPTPEALELMARQAYGVGMPDLTRAYRNQAANSKRQTIEQNVYWKAFCAGWPKEAQPAVPIQLVDTFLSAIDELTQRQIPPEKVTELVREKLKKGRTDYRFDYVPGNIHEVMVTVMPNGAGKPQNSPLKKAAGDHESQSEKPFKPTGVPYRPERDDPRRKSNGKP